MKYPVYGVATASVVGLLAVCALGVSATGWAETPDAGTPGNQSTPPTAAAPITPAAPASQPPQANTDAKPPALAASPGCPPAPVHKHVARYHSHYRSHGSSTASAWGYQSQTGAMAIAPTQVVAVTPPPVYIAPPPPPPAPLWYAAPGWRPWFPGRWHVGWARRW